MGFFLTGSRPAPGHGPLLRADLVNPALPLQEIVARGFWPGGAPDLGFVGGSKLLGARLLAVFAAEGTARLGLGLEGLPDHRRLRVLRHREDAEDPLASD